METVRLIGLHAMGSYFETEIYVPLFPDVRNCITAQVRSRVHPGRIGLFRINHKCILCQGVKANVT